MYRSSLGARDKGGAIIAVVAIHALLLVMLLNLAGKLDIAAPQSVLRVFDLSAPPPPPTPPPPPQQRASPKARRPQGGAAPANIKSQAAPVAAPVPRIVLPVPVPVTAVKTPAEGTAPTQGAAAVAGPGTGAGGQGNGTGGGSGSGAGSGSGGAVSPPQLVTPVLRGRDFPGDLLDQWPRGTPVFLRLRVDAQGYVAECIVDRGTGVAVIDSEMCNLVHQRLRFRPALNRSGQAVAGWFGYGQTPPR
jgi:protein TonB